MKKKSREQQLADDKVDEKKWAAAFNLIEAQDMLIKIIKHYGPMSEEARVAHINARECQKKYNRYARI
jgi:hypothetical protein